MNKPRRGACILIILFFWAGMNEANNSTSFSIPPVSPQKTADPAKSTQPIEYDAQTLIAGHLLRRMGFGPNPSDMATVIKMGTTAYIAQQLNPNSINDKAAESKLPAKPRDVFDYETWLKRWLLRMVYSKRQLREKMTLIWHEHFATGIDKVAYGCLMSQQEEMFRSRGLGNFKDLLIAITKDKAMLAYLDNNYNNGQAYDDNGNLIPPNENYAREFLQLFSMGPSKLRPDGTVVTTSKGAPVASYTEKDVREIARAFTGWYHDYKCKRKARFYAPYHDPGDKVILGVKVPGRAGAAGAREIEDVVEIVMKHPNVAPFISRILIQKLATETPNPAYVSRVASVFSRTNGSIRATLEAIFTDAEFYSPSVILTQYKEPAEQFIGALRGLEGDTRGGDFVGWLYSAGHLPYFPPSVFSFYPPGEKSLLINAALLINRDRVADGIVYNSYETSIDPQQLIKKYNLRTPENVVDYLSNALIAGPFDPEVRTKIIRYMKGRVDDEKFRGAAWLVLCSPDFQRN